MFSSTNLFNRAKHCSFFHTGSIPVLRSALGSPPNNSILLDNVVCSGQERDLLECDYISTGTISCDKSHEAGVQCEGMQRHKHVRKSVDSSRDAC